MLQIVTESQRYQHVEHTTQGPQQSLKVVFKSLTIPIFNYKKKVNPFLVKHLENF